MTIKKTKVWSPYYKDYPSGFQVNSRGELIQVLLTPIAEREFRTPNKDKDERVNLCVFENGVWAVITVVEGTQGEVRLWCYRHEALEDFGKKYKKYFKQDISAAKRERGYSLSTKKMTKTGYDIGIVVINEMDITLLEKVALANWNDLRETFKFTSIRVPPFQDYKAKFFAELQNDGVIAKTRRHSKTKSKD
jgi:hypothetical protein